eukprot:scaffold49634_cov19-Tisochrysis_lutea.AAC.1
MGYGIARSCAATLELCHGCLCWLSVSAVMRAADFCYWCSYLPGNAPWQLANITALAALACCTPNCNLLTKKAWRTVEHNNGAPMRFAYTHFSCSLHSKPQFADQEGLVGLGITMLELLKIQVSGRAEITSLVSPDFRSLHEAFLQQVVISAISTVACAYCETFLVSELQISVLFSLKGLDSTLW